MNETQFLELKKRISSPSHFSKIGFGRSVTRRDDDESTDPVVRNESAIGDVVRNTDINETDHLETQECRKNHSHTSMFCFSRSFLLQARSGETQRNGNNTRIKYL